MTAATTDTTRYSAIAIILHWTIAILIIGQLAGGFFMHKFAEGDLKFTIFQLHKSFGITILLLSLARLGWRLTHRAPPLPAHMPGWERFAAKLAHWGLYGLMIGLPLVGWAVVSSSPKGIPTLLFGAVPWPHLPLPHSDQLSDTFAGVHEALAFSMAGLFFLHAAAALRHHVLLRDQVFRHMAPWFAQAPKGARLPLGQTAFLGLAAIVIAGGLGVLMAASDSEEEQHEHAQVQAQNRAQPEDPAPAEGNGSYTDQTTEDPTPAQAIETMPPGPEPSASAATVADPAAGADWAVDYEESKVSFSAIAEGAPFTGVLPKFDARIHFDPDDLAAASVTAVFDMSAADAGDAERNDALPSPVWLDVANHKTARFETTDIRKTGEGAYEAHGALTMRGVTKPIVLPFTLTIDGDVAHMHGETSFARLDYGIGDNAYFTSGDSVSLEPKVIVDLTAHRAAD